MTENETSEIGAQELRVDIQAGDDYAATPRLKAALDELAAALEEAETEDVAGFADLKLGGGFSMLYRSPLDLSYTENDPKGKRKGNVEYSWKIEEGTK